jgi:hypothetical protein
MPPSFPSIGAATIAVLAVTPVAIHGDLYFDLRALHEQAGPLRLRIPAHACAGLPDGEPRAGQRLTLTLLMGQVTSAELAR